MDNAVDDTVNFTSNDTDTTLKVTGFEASDAILELAADEEDDTADLFSLHSTAANTLLIKNGTTTLQTHTSAGAVTMVGGITGDGGDAVVGFIQNQVASTTTTLTIAQCGSTIVSDSADVVTLPEASTALGCRYTFVCGFAGNFDVNPNDGTDAINSPFEIIDTGTSSAITPAAGDAVRCATIGESMTLEAVEADLWVQIGPALGTWTDVN
jgi:hypothetical protein